MRKDTKAAVAAFLGGYDYDNSNTAIRHSDTETRLILHGNTIARRSPDGTIEISTEGWDTVTTRERLNGIPGVNCYHKRGDLYLNGALWDGDWIEVKA